MILLTINKAISVNDRLSALLTVYLKAKLLGVGGLIGPGHLLKKKLKENKAKPFRKVNVPKKSQNSCQN